MPEGGMGASLLLGLRVPSRGARAWELWVSSCTRGGRPAGKWEAELCPASPGLILRRCELDEEGIAYWEPPTYIRCISIDYRNIQMMVRPGSEVTCPAQPITRGHSALCPQTESCVPSDMLCGHESAVATGWGL